jgi:plasmid stabilization system protein ParE
MGQALPLIWSAPALDDLDEIAAHIAADKPPAAAAFVARVLEAVERLREHPESGRRVPELRRARYREVIVAPCRIIYRVERGRVLIVHVFRGQRRLRKRRVR